MQHVVFGDFSFDFDHRLLNRHDNPVELGARAVRLLECLLHRRGEVVPKADLVGAAWGDQAVEDSNLSVQISALRRVLGKDWAGRDWIVTVERVGYRFLPAPPRRAELGRLGLPTLEVGIALEGSSGNVIADAETDQIIATLSVLSSLHTRHRGDTTLQSDYHLVGTVGYAPAGANIRVRLTDGITHRVLWAETFDLADDESTGILWHRIAAYAEERLQLAETRRSLVERAGSTAPYDLYLRARANIRTGEHDDNARALAMLLEALEVEPDNPRLLAAAAEALHTRRVVGWPDVTGHDQALRLAFARRAWETAESDASSLSLAGNAMFSSGEPEVGLALTELAAELSPGSPLVLGCAGHSHLWIGELDDARCYLERAIAIAPRAAVTRFAYSSLANVLNITHQPERAFAAAQRGRAVSPGYSGLHWQMMVANLALNRGAAARHGFGAYREMHPHARLDNIRNGLPFRRDDRARPLLSALQELGMPE